MCCSMDQRIKLSICRQGEIVVNTDVLFPWIRELN